MMSSMRNLPDFRPPRWLSSCFGRLLRCREGIAALEFGFAAPAIILASAVLFEISSMMFVSTLVEGGLRQAARFGITGFSPAGVSREDRIREIIARNTFGLVDMSTATINQQIYPSFGQIGQPEPYDDVNSSGGFDAGEPYQDINGNGEWDADMGAAGAGGPGDVVLYRVEVDWDALVPLMAPLMGADGKIRLSATVAVRNEPFDPPPPALPGGTP